MSEPKKYKDESQDARRHDQHKAVHPNEKMNKTRDKRDKNKQKNKASPGQV